MPAISDAKTWQSAPSGTPATGFADTGDWFHIGSLTAGQSARISILPDYFIAYHDGVTTVDYVGLVPETEVGARLYQRITAVDADGTVTRFVSVVGNSVSAVDTILTQLYPAGTYSFDQITTVVPAARVVTLASGGSYTYHDDFYVEVYGLASTVGPPSTLGRYLVTTGDPTGQRDATWGNWLDGWDLLTSTAVGATTGGPVATDPTTGSGPAQVVSVPSAAQWTATQTASGYTFVSPQFNLNAITGAWSLIGAAADGAWTSGTDTSSYLNAVSQSLAWGAILSRDLDAPEIVQTVYGSAGTATTIFNIESSFIGRLFRALDDVPDAIATGREAEVQAQLDEATSRLGSETREAARDAIVDAVVQDTFAEYIVNFWRSAKLVKHESTQFFTLQTGTAAVTAADHRDTLLGSPLDDAFSGGANDDTAYGAAGNDTFTGGSGNDVLAGGAGIDTAVYSGARSSYAVSGSAAARTVSGAEGIDTLTGMERLQFSDTKVAFDLGTGESAGDAVRLIGAAFGASQITTHPEYVGVGITLRDAGMSLAQLAALALGTPVFLSIAGSSGNVDFVNTVYRNVTGALPSLAERSAYVALLEGGSMTQADLLALAANTDVNAAHIGLVGLQQSGAVFA